MKLNPDQTLAAEAAGSAAVTAGAGTGKTSMLAARYLHHVLAHGHSPLSVVAVTFTDKAADELRKRTRKTAAASGLEPEIVAEIEAAQISTMHSLAQRICRDFYDLAGIPADFTVLDEAESPLWLAERFDEAVAGIDRTVIEDLGFHWLISAIRELLKDPWASERALGLGAENWRRLIEAESASAVEKLISSDAWAEAEATLGRFSGPPDDKLEQARAAAVNAMAAIKSGIEVVNSVAVLKTMLTHHGKAANWPDGGKELLGGCLKALKAAASEVFERATLIFGPYDEEAARRLDPLKAAFQHVRTYIAEEKRREKLLDFSDLELYALKVLDHPEAVAHYRARWHAYLVDEFQDTNPIQAEILQRLTAGAKITIVGDEKQAIYGFRGADIDVFARFRTEIVGQRGGQAVPLKTTYRTHDKLVATMNTIFAPVLGRLHQPLEHHRFETGHQGPFVRSAVVETVKGTHRAQQQIIEARYIADQIRLLHEAEGVPYRDIAILSRTWAPLDVYLGVLAAEGIPAVHAGGGSLLDTREARDVIALLAFLSEPDDDVPLVAMLRSPFFAVSDRVLYEAAKRLNGRSWWQTIGEIEAFERPVHILQQLLAARSTNGAEQVLRLADDLTGYGAVIANLPHGERRTADLRGVFEIFRRLDRRGAADVFGASRYLRELVATETSIPRPQLDAGEAVSLMTIHKAKGLEWPVVFVPDLARKPPSDHAPVTVDSEAGVAFKMEGEAFKETEPAIHKLIKLRRKERAADEARRVLYVAITRAKDKVILTSTAEKGSDIDILRPGLDAAGIVDEIIPWNEDLAIAPSPREPEMFTPPVSVNVAPVTIGLSEIPVTALTTYAKCPKRFEFQYVDGHPGISDGFAGAMEIGTLAHTALELGIDDVDRLRRESPASSDESLAAALAFAAKFRTDAAFAEFRDEVTDREVPFIYPIGGLILNGKADLVGPDFVLDYKTDAEMHPEEHRFQLWAYAAGLRKPRAVIAYIRLGKIHVLDGAGLAAVEAEAAEIVRRIRRADYTATPSPDECGRCRFASICKFRFSQ